MDTTAAAADTAQAIQQSGSFWQQVQTWFIESGIEVLLIIILTFVAVKLAGMIADRTFGAMKKRKMTDEAQKRADTLASVIRYVLTITIFIIAFMMLLEEIGVDIGPILAAAGVLGIAVGFGAQGLVKDVISGFFILLEDQIRVGDVVNIGGKGGLVEKVNLRMVILRDLHGNVHYIPNGEVGIVTNMTKDFSRYVFDIGVAYREDPDQVMEVMKEVDEEMRNDPYYGENIIEPLEVLGVEAFGDSAVVVRARTTTKPIKQWETAREFRRRLKKRFDDLDIEIPFPHVTLYMGQDKEGNSPPMNVDLYKPGDGDSARG